jgi:hypothetical protein
MAFEQPPRPTSTAAAVINNIFIAYPENEFDTVPV